MTRRLLRPEIVWPTAVVLLLLAGIGSAFAVLFFSRVDGGAEILDDYYRRGLAWDSSAVERNAVGRFGWMLSLDPALVVDDDGLRTVRVTVLDSTGGPVEDLSITVTAYRPQYAQPVARATTEPADRAGHYVARLPVHETGLWDFELAGQRGTEPFVLRLRREIIR